MWGINISNHLLIIIIFCKYVVYYYYFPWGMRSDGFARLFLLQVWELPCTLGPPLSSLFIPGGLGGPSRGASAPRPTPQRMTSPHGSSALAVFTPSSACVRHPPGRWPHRISCSGGNAFLSTCLAWCWGLYALKPWRVYIAVLWEAWSLLSCWTPLNHMWKPCH